MSGHAASRVASLTLNRTDGDSAVEEPFQCHRVSGLVVPRQENDQLDFELACCVLVRQRGWREKEERAWRGVTWSGEAAPIACRYAPESGRGDRGESWHAVSVGMPHAVVRATCCCCRAHAESEMGANVEGELPCSLQVNGALVSPVWEGECDIRPR